MKRRIIIVAISSMVPCAVAHAAKTITINTNTAGELADACNVKLGNGDVRHGVHPTLNVCSHFSLGPMSTSFWGEQDHDSP